MDEPEARINASDSVIGPILKKSFHVQLFPMEIKQLAAKKPKHCVNDALMKFGAP